MPSHQRRSSSRRQGRVGETSADRQDQGRPVTLSSLRPEHARGGGIISVGAGDPSVLVCVCTWEPGEQTVELPLGQRGPGQVQRTGLALDDACEGLVSERATPAYVHVAPETLVTAPAQNSSL